MIGPLNAKRNPASPLHKESLLHIPLVAQMLADPFVEFRERAVDRGWQYEQILSRSVTGFNPWSGSIMYASTSRFAQWLKRPRESARPLNDGDMLVNEVLMAAHDYLHIWAYSTIASLRPSLRFGWGQINKGNFEDFVFCHLLSEAVAVVGLDYWLLSEKTVDGFCGIGSAMGPLAVSYREELMPEYRRFNRQFQVQTPSFLGDIVRFYCSGDFIGFGERDLRSSPVLMRWLQHEISYGLDQRNFTRAWLAFLAKDDIRLRRENLSAAVVANKRWQSRLIEDVSHLLWEKVKLGRLHEVAPPVEARRRWKRDPDRPLDFRFLNFQQLSRQGEVPDSLWKSLNPQSEDYECLLNQFIAWHRFAGLEDEFLAMVRRLMANQDHLSLKMVFKSVPKVPSAGRELEDLMVLN